MMVNIKDVLSYDPRTGEFRWKVCRKGCRVGDIVGSKRHDGYIKIGVGYSNIFAHRLAWWFVHGVWPNKNIDHIDGNPSNNRIANLRLATQSQNLMNSEKRKDNTSGIRGVSRYRNKWQAKIWVNGNCLWLGCFDTIEEAAKKYKVASELLHGQYARTEA